jgi:serine/threonine protein kinase
MKKISKYQVFSELQHGPITQVYKAMQPELQRVVLVKQLNPDRIADEELVERFKQEGLILAKINSPHVITIFDFGFDDNVPFLVTEFIEGNTLAELIQQNGALPWNLGLFILQQLIQGLNALHHQNIIHQDIKPENIFISNEGEVKLGDLGFSISLDQTDQQIQGTPAYLAPEVVEGSPVDFRSDLYSLGLVGYEMLTGENPFAADDMQTILNRIVNLKPINVHSVKPEVPEKLSLLIAKLMARNPAHRFQSAHDLSQELENLKVSLKIKVDGNCLINFSKHPDQYQVSQIIADKHSEPSIQKPKKQKIPVLAAVIIIVLGILIVFLGKLMDRDLSVLPEKTDTTGTAIEQNLSRATNEHEIPIHTEQKSTTPGIKTSKEYPDNSSIKSVIKDTLKLRDIAQLKQDTLVITSDPRAWIFQNGDSLGITSLSIILGAKKEPIELELQAPGFPVIKKAVTISEQSAHNIHINLWKEVGYLDMTITPWGEIWIDGDSIDVSPVNRPLILAPGKHRLMVRHPSLKSSTELIYVAVGETLKKSIQLQRVP